MGVFFYWIVFYMLPVYWNVFDFCNLILHPVYVFWFAKWKTTICEKWVISSFLVFSPYFLCSLTVLGVGTMMKSDPGYPHLTPVLNGILQTFHLLWVSCRYRLWGEGIVSFCSQFAKGVCGLLLNFTKYFFASIDIIYFSFPSVTD